MKVQINCPCCQAKAMTIWQKVSLSLYSTRQCASCGSTLGIEQTGTGWLVFGWIPFALSGLFALPLKALLGAMGIGLILLPHIYLIPLVKKQEETRQAAPTWLTPWLFFVAVGMFSTDWINWIPDLSTKIVAFLASVLISASIIRIAWQRILKADEKILAFGLGFLIVLAMHYFALSVLPPALITLLGGSETAAEASIISKRHTNKLTRCANKADILIAGDEQKHEICLPEDTWKALQKGDQVLLKMLETDYGRLISGVQPSNSY